ncbi:FlgO family outer membrane protein [Ferrimonas lipolytica]|uniref:FlgO domain-containing protein n=1 Tax=Ferrimonas lipolytica TaxID=2724191 RepID=A0A6H1UF49_9GAMM|nr:FlgO family outer membrane protein [Ferrimonas lipolytica]QIZ77259.1 hypothetical protein HER31_10435 [Ferrimonas lipolytica]
MRWTMWVVLALLVGCAQSSTSNGCQFERHGCNGLPPQGALNVLAKQITNELTNNHHNPIEDKVVAVSTPVALDGFGNSDQFALQLGDALLSALHQQGFTVVDLNSGDVVRVTQSGNLLLSRDIEQLPNSLEVDHVVVATMGSSSDSVQIFTRILALDGNKVVATSQTSVNWRDLPNYYKPSRLVTLEHGKLFRHAKVGEGEVTQWNH